MKITIFKKKKSFKKGGFHTNPNIGWQIIIVLVFTVVLAFFAYGFYLFLVTSEKFEMPLATNETREKIIEKERLKKTLEYFTEKATKSSEIINAPAQVVDPSL